MKVCVTLVGALLLENVLGFAAIGKEPLTGSLIARDRFKKRQSPGFNAAQQYISTSGVHAFQPPGAGDIRGPCPGYLPHNGVATPLQFDNAIEGVFRVGPIFSQILSFYGLETAGDGVSWSIGSAPSPGLLGQGLGLDGTHNNYEGDASATRGDLYTAGNNYLLQLSQFKQLYNLQPNAPTSNYDLNIMSKFRSLRFKQSISQNPYFFNGPVSGLLVTPAAFMFVYRLMGNKSAEYPEGQTTPAILKTFHSISGPDNKLVYTPGHERIPDNWYTRAVGDDYEVDLFAEDVAKFLADDPTTAKVGGNTGSTNSFTGVDLTNVTGGVFNSATLGQGNNAACFALQVADILAPSIVKPGLGGVLTDVENAIKPASSLLGCPQLSDFETGELAKYPGYSKLQNGHY